MAENRRKAKLEMLADFFREAAVLVLVFVPLEIYVRGGLSGKTAAVVILLSAFGLAFGIFIERRRP